MSIYFAKIRESIELDVVEIAKYQTALAQKEEFDDKNFGWFGIPRQVFCFVDFLGSIAFETKKREKHAANPRKAAEFIENYFPKHYKPYKNLLIAMWRNGTVHQGVPYKYFAKTDENAKVVVNWTTNRSNEEHNRKVNMNTFDKKGHNNEIYLSINISQLADDLLYAFKKFNDKMKKDKSFRNDCFARLRQSLEMNDCNTLGKMSNLVRDQILLAKSSTKGEIDENLQVKYYNHQD